MQITSVLLLTACASTQLPIVPEAQPKPVVQHVEQAKILPDLVSTSVDMEVSKNFALESIPTDDTSKSLSTSYKVPLSISDRIVKAADRNAYSDFPSRNDILAIIAVESSLNPSASNRGNEGLMQIRKKSHLSKLLGRNLYNIEVNIEIGSAVLREYFLQLKSKKAAVLAYNVGIGNYIRKRIRMEYYLKYSKHLKIISKM
jgi:hypothetical protein